MKCLRCPSGESAPALVTVTLERDGTTVVFKNVPAEVCGECGEEYFADEVSERLLSALNEAATRSVELEVRDYPAAPAA